MAVLHGIMGAFAIIWLVRGHPACSTAYPRLRTATSLWRNESENLRTTLIHLACGLQIEPKVSLPAKLLVGGLAGIAGTSVIL